MEFLLSIDQTEVSMITKTVDARDLDEFLAKHAYNYTVVSITPSQWKVEGNGQVVSYYLVVLKEQS